VSVPGLRGVELQLAGHLLSRLPDVQLAAIKVVINPPQPQQLALAESDTRASTYTARSRSLSTTASTRRACATVSPGPTSYCGAGTRTSFTTFRGTSSSRTACSTALRRTVELFLGNAVGLEARRSVAEYPGGEFAALPLSEAP
jgi:hypothetical protein